MLGIGNKSLGKPYVDLFLLLPLRIKGTFPEGHYEHIAAQIYAGLEKHKKKNAKVAKDGTVEIKNGGLLDISSRVPYEKAQPWQFAAGLGIRSNLGLVMYLLLSNDSDIYTIKNIGAIRLEEFIAVALCELVDHHTLEDAYAPYTLLANLMITILLRRFTNSKDLKSANLSKFSSLNDENNDLKATEATYKKMRAKFSNRRVTDEDIVWIAERGKTLKAENHNLSRWAIAGKIQAGLKENKKNKIGQKQVTGYLKNAGM